VDETEPVVACLEVRRPEPEETEPEARLGKGPGWALSPEHGTAHIGPYQFVVLLNRAAPAPPVHCSPSSALLPSSSVSAPPPLSRRAAPASSPQVHHRGYLVRARRRVPHRIVARLLPTVISPRPQSPTVSLILSGFKFF
jgi:hypothetical protein